MNLSQLRFVKAVAEHSSFSKAAAECHVTQPSLSNAVALFEDEIGARIFFRTTRKVLLTPFGEHMLPQVEAALGAVDELGKSAKAYLHPTFKIVRIGLTPLISMQMLQSVLEPFRRRHPEIEVIFKECLQDDLSERLEKEKIDIAFMVKGHPHRGKEFARMDLYDEHLFYLPRDGGSGANPGPISVPQIAGETFALTAGGCGLTRTVRELFRVNRRLLKEYPGHALSYKAIEEWTALGISAGVLPFSKVTTQASCARPILSVGNKTAKVSFEAIWRKSGALAPYVGTLLKHLRETAPRISA